MLGKFAVFMVWNHIFFNDEEKTFEKLLTIYIFRTVLVYRVGGRSCDATIVELKYGIISILDTEHSDELGGKLILSALTKYLADEFYRY